MVQSVEYNENLDSTEIFLQKVCEGKGCKNLSYQICNPTDSIPNSEFRVRDYLFFLAIAPLFLCHKRDQNDAQTVGKYWMFATEDLEVCKVLERNKEKKR